MEKRQVLEIPGVDDGRSAVPAATHIGNLIFGMRVTGQRPTSGEIPHDPEAEIEQLFENLATYLERAGGSLGNLALLTVFLRDLRHRELLNKPWLRLFPDENDRPARNTVQRTIDERLAIVCEFTAVLGSTRQVLRLPGVAEVHNPAPTSVRAGNYVYCVRVTGQEPDSGCFPEEPREQIEQLFKNIDALMQQAGGSIDDMAYITISLRSADGEGLQNVAFRDVLNEIWLKYFPNSDDRPARHTIPAPLLEGRLITASFHGVLGKI